MSVADDPPTPPRLLPPLLAGAAAAAALVAAWLLQDGDGRQVLLARALYWLTPVALALWLLAALRARAAGGEGLGAWLRARAGVAAAAAGLAVAVVVGSPPAMRMQFDETSLLGAAYGMHDGRAALMPIGALPLADGLAVTDWNLDKRPPLFAFLVSVVHDVAGPRAANAFVVNGGVLWALLALVGWRLRAAAGAFVGLLGMALLAGLPLLAACATSAGFELLALALLAAAVAAACDFVRAPSPATANALLATVLLGAKARYESLPVLLVLALAAAAAVRRWPRDRATAPLLAAAPLLLAALALLAVHGRDASFYPEAKGQDLVAFAHFVDHLGPLLAALFAWGPQPFAALPTAAAVVAGALALAAPGGRGAVALHLALPVGAATVIALSWFHGDVREDTALRLFLPLAALLALLPALGCAAWRARRTAALLLPAAIVVGAINLAALRREAAMPRGAAAVLLDAVDVAVAGLRPDPRRTLIVSAVAQYLIVQGHAAVTPQQWLVRRPRLPAGVDVLVLTTPLDDACGAHAGDPADVLAGAVTEPLGDVKVSATQRVAAWRLRRMQPDGRDAGQGAPRPPQTQNGR